MTGAFAMIAGGASGIIVMARELGADERMVAVLQYLRVLLIVVLMPVVATTVYGAVARDRVRRLPPTARAGRPACCSRWAAGSWGSCWAGSSGCPCPPCSGRWWWRPALDLAGLARGRRGARLVQSAAFLVIGLQVGVSFTRESLRTIGRALPLALAVIVVLIVASAGLGAVLSAATGVSALDGYLATTPGGLYAVLATATDIGADVTFVLAVQVLRLFVDAAERAADRAGCCGRADCTAPRAYPG